jgi:hypothetical protein
MDTKALTNISKQEQDETRAHVVHAEKRRIHLILIHVLLKVIAVTVFSTYDVYNPRANEIRPWVIK